ncbi:MAG: restriction endonuclease subunit S [Prevotella salivae]|nr:restriction endonuclease subunit S [Segatella salivae]
MNGKQLKNSILQWAIQGKLVPQDPNDEPASVLLDKIRAEKARLIKEGKIKKDKKESIIYRGEDNSYYEKFADGKVVCIDDEIPYKLPFGWTWCRLNELGIYRKGPFGSSLTKSMFVPKSKHSIKVYEQKNAIQKDYRLGEYYISKDKFSEMQSFVTHPSDIIVSCAGTIGETYFLPQDAPIGIINQALMRVRLYNLDIVDYWQLFFAYILLIEKDMKGAGSAIKNIPSFEYLKGILVPLPPLQEQKRIIEKYNEVAKFICYYTQQKEKLDLLNDSLYSNIQKSILQEAIQGKLIPQDPNDEPASVLLQRLKEEKQRLVKERKLKKKDIIDSIIYKGDDNKYYEQIGNKITCIEEEIPFKIPKEWCWVRLSDIVLINPRNHVPDNTMAAFIPMERIDATFLSSYSYVERKWGEIKQGFTHFSDGDVAFAKITPCFQNRKSMILNNLPNGIGAGTTELKVLRPYRNTLSVEYLLFFLESPYFVEEAIFKGTANQQRIMSGYMESKLFPLPPLEEQKRMSKKIREVYKQIIL